MLRSIALALAFNFQEFGLGGPVSHPRKPADSFDACGRPSPWTDTRNRLCGWCHPSQGFVGPQQLWRPRAHMWRVRFRQPHCQAQRARAVDSNPVMVQDRVECEPVFNMSVFLKSFIYTNGAECSASTPRCLDLNCGPDSAPGLIQGGFC